MTSHYKQVLAEARDKTDKLASEYITELYLILRNEEHHSPEECRTKIESDCGDMWSEDTIRRYLPPETKSAMKRKAGKVSAEVKKKKKAKLLAATTANSGQYSAVLDSDDNNYGHDSVEMNPTENGSVEQKEPESRTFQGTADSQDSGNVWTEDYYLTLIAERHKDEKTRTGRRFVNGRTCK